LKFFADECCDAGIVASLRIEGHDVLYVLEEEPGLQDEVVLQRAYIERFRFRPLLFETPSR